MNRLFEARNIVLVFIFLVSTTAAVAANGAGQAPQDAVQPTSERLDLGMYSRIRTEGLQHSRIMDYASALFDDIGPRLTGSSNLARATQWTREQFAEMGCVNAHQESWGEFGMGWRQIATSIDMSSPDAAVLIGQATPWSPATAGVVHANVIAVPFLTEEKGFDAWKGKLAGRILLYGKSPTIVPDPKPLLEHYDAAKLQQIFSYPLNGDFREQHVFPATPQENGPLLSRRMRFKKGLRGSLPMRKLWRCSYQAMPEMAALCATTITRVCHSMCICLAIGSPFLPRF